MAILPRDTDASRAIQMLAGILQGMSADGKITPGEVLALKDWLRLHSNFHDVCPFSDLYDLVKDLEAAEQVDVGVREEILEYCDWVFAGDGPVDHMTSEIRALHGFLQGIASDGEITFQEAKALKRWLKDRQDILHGWPFRDIFQLVSEVLADNHISPEEHARLLVVCLQFSERPAEKIVIDPTIMPNLTFLQTDAPELKTLDYVCKKEVCVLFEGKTFCFTGKMQSGSRAEMHRRVEERGGVPKDNVVQDLDFLVVGGNSNPAWIYSTYGRKIERVMEIGGRTAIIHEEGFVAAL
jgi:hypothetical protein